MNETQRMAAERTRRQAVEDEYIIAVVRERAPVSAIEITRALIERGQCYNRSAIGEVDRIRGSMQRLVKAGRLQVIARRHCRLPAKQHFYALAERGAS